MSSRLLRLALRPAKTTSILRPTLPHSSIRNASITPSTTQPTPPLRARDDRIVTPKGNPNISLLSRSPNRPLPTLESLSSARKWLKTIPIFLAMVAVSALAIFNYQKTNSPVVTAILYSLRTNPAVRQVLGNEVYFASKWAWISGEINLVQGQIDVNFGVGGTKQKGTVRFRAKRVGGRAGRFVTNEWSLKADDGTVMDLLSEGDPLAGSSL